MNAIQPGDNKSHEHIKSGLNRLANASAAALAAALLPDNLRQEFERAHAEGYCVHLGDAGDGELDGRYWWTLHRAGWGGIESSCGDWPTEGEAMVDACRAHQAEVDHA